jgi:glycosyltransferase involved in cell wall biosynthesis
MRVAIDTRTVSDHFPGIGRYTYHLTCALARRLQPDDRLLVLYNPALANTRYPLDLLASAPGVEMIATGARPFSPGEQLILARQLRTLGADVTHFPYFILPYAAPRPWVVTIHDAIPQRFPRYYRLHQRWAYHLATRLALRGAARVVCVSAATRDDLRAAFGLPEERARVVYEAADARFHPCAPDEVAAVRARYALPETYLLYLGINKPHKNLPALVEAYAQLLDAPPLVLAGREDPRYPQARRRAELLGLGERVRFPGAIADADLPALYSGAHAFAFVSEYEGFGLPPLEAMACGAPVLCSDAPSLVEVVGPAALVVAPADRGAIAAGLERLLANADLRAGLREQGLELARKYTWDRAAEETWRVYEGVKG